MSQKKSILLHLNKVGNISPIEALNNYGCFRLAARIKDLRDDGENIATLNEDGHARYILITEKEV